MTPVTAMSRAATATAVVTGPAPGVLTGRVRVALLCAGRGARGRRASRAVPGTVSRAASGAAALRIVSRPVSRTADEHLRVVLPAPMPSLAPLADVLVAAAEAGAEPHRQAAALAARHPGALVVAVHRGPDLWMRLGPDGLALTLRARCPAAGPPWAVWASVAHTWLVAGLPAAELGTVPMRLVWGQSAASAVPSVPGSSSRPSRARTASAWADFERPTAE